MVFQKGILSTSCPIKKGQHLSTKTEFNKGCIPWNKGKTGLHKHSAMTKKKMRESQKRGKDHWNWQGGITPRHESIRRSREYKLWRNAVYERDNWTCVWCGSKGTRLEADHIKRFSEFPALRFAIDNGRTLCKPCHKKTNTFGRKKHD